MIKKLNNGYMVSYDRKIRGKNIIRLIWIKPPLKYNKNILRSKSNLPLRTKNPLLKKKACLSPQTTKKIIKKKKNIDEPKKRSIKKIINKFEEKNQNKKIQQLKTKHAIKKNKRRNEKYNYRIIKKDNNDEKSLLINCIIIRKNSTIKKLMRDHKKIKTQKNSLKKTSEPRKKIENSILDEKKTDNKKENFFIVFKTSLDKPELKEKHENTLNDNKPKNLSPIKKSKKNSKVNKKQNFLKKKRNPTDVKFIKNKNNNKNNKTLLKKILFEVHKTEIINKKDISLEEKKENQKIIIPHEIKKTEFQKIKEKEKKALESIKKYEKIFSFQLKNGENSQNSCINETTSLTKINTIITLNPENYNYSSSEQNSQKSPFNSKVKYNNFYTNDTSSFRPIIKEKNNKNEEESEIEEIKSNISSPPAPGSIKEFYEKKINSYDKNEGNSYIYESSSDFDDNKIELEKNDDYLKHNTQYIKYNPLDFFNKYEYKKHYKEDELYPIYTIPRIKPINLLDGLKIKKMLEDNNINFNQKNKENLKREKECYAGDFNLIDDDNNVKVNVVCFNDDKLYRGQMPVKAECLIPFKEDNDVNTDDGQLKMEIERVQDSWVNLFKDLIMNPNYFEENMTRKILK